jgi:tight adherence protein B
VGRGLVATVAGGVGVGCVLVWPPTLAAVVAVGGAAMLWHQGRARRARRRTGAAVIEVCDVLAGELAAGRPPDHALEEARTAWPPWRQVVDGARLGADVPVAIRAAGELPGAEALRLLAAGWEVSHRTGHGLSATIGRVAADTRAEAATHRIVDSELASARSTARLVAALPVPAWLMSLGAGGDPFDFLLDSAPGLGCLLAGLGLQVLGLWWIERLASRS